MDLSEKQNRYLELIERLKDDYFSRDEKRENENHSQTVYVKWCKYCKTQINLWSYWQGSLNAQILLVGQDWGSFAPEKRTKSDKIMLSNIQKMDEGKETHYFDGIKDKYILSTDRHIITLFSELGRECGVSNNEYADIRRKNDKLFFTNLCLGYRNEGYSGYFRREWFNEDIKYLVGVDNENERMPGLLGIIMPDVVICLGKRTFEAVMHAIPKRITKNDMRNNFYAALDGDTNFEDVSYQGKNIRFYAVAHPGGQGTANRKRYCSSSDKTKSGLELQKEDWREIGRYLKEL